jgi:hypothetical protein
MDIFNLELEAVLGTVEILSMDDFLLVFRSLAEFDLHLQGLDFWHKELVFQKPCHNGAHVSWSWF